MRREGVVVSLDGHGGDELLGGYGLHLQVALLRGRGLVVEPRRTLDLINTLRHMQPNEQVGTFMNDVGFAALSIPRVRAIARALPFVRGRYRRWQELVGQYSCDSDARLETTRTEEQAIDALGPLTGVLYRSFHTHSLPRILRNFDVHSMGNGVEVRMPLLDWRLVCYAFSVPDQSKVGGGYAKLLLREAMRGILPESVRLRRDKLGYNVPIASWLDHGLRDWLWNELNDAEFLRSELWDGHALLALAQTKRDSKTRWTAVEAYNALLAVTAHWWLTRWARSRRN
jgi:asparagine synthase (glutamine-hydrolysing)